MLPNPSTHIIPYWRCTSDGCPERAVWGEAWMPTFCDTHKHDSKKLESLRNDRCLLCKRIFIVNKNKHCKPCSELVTEKQPEKPLEPPTHPNFTVSQYPVLRTAKSSPDVISSRRPSPTLDPEQLSRALRRSSALSLMSVRSNESGISATSAASAITGKSTESARTRGSGSTMNLNLKLTKLQAQGELQLAVTSTKLKLKAAKATLAQFSPIEHTPSKMAAIEAVAQAEKEVEDACKAWCHAQRS